MQVVPSELPTYHHSNFVVSFSLRLLNTNTKKKERNLASSHHFYPPKIWIPWGFGCLSTEPAACVIFPRSSSSTPRCIRALWKISIGTQPWKSWFLEEKKQTPPKVTPKISYIYFLMNSFYIFLHFWHMRDHAISIASEAIRRLPARTRRLTIAHHVANISGRHLYKHWFTEKWGEIPKMWWCKWSEVSGNKVLVSRISLQNPPETRDSTSLPPMFLVLVGLCLLHGSLKNKARQILFKVHPPRRVLSGIQANPRGLSTIRRIYESDTSPGRLHQ